MTGIKIALLLFVIFVCSIAEIVPSSNASPKVPRLRNSRRPVRDLSDGERTYGIVAINGNYTYISAEVIVQPLPTVGGSSDVFIGLQDAVENFVGVSISYIPGGHNDCYIFIFVNGPMYCDDGHYINPGDVVKGEVFLANNTWIVNGYVNGGLLATYQVPLHIGYELTFDSNPYGPATCIGTASGQAQQGYVSNVDSSYLISIGTQFVFPNVSGGTYFALNSNNGLVLDVSGAEAKEGARVDLYPKKTPAAANQLWTFSGDSGIIYSKLAGNYSLGVNNKSQIILTKLTRQTVYVYPPKPFYPLDHFTQNVAKAGVWFASFDSLACNQYPASNHVNFTNIVIRKGALQATPVWSVNISEHSCGLAATTTTSSVNLKWNNTL